MAGTAERMAKNQKQVAISEFFEKNKHFLGFDSLTRSLITAIPHSRGFTSMTRGDARSYLLPMHPKPW